MIVDFWQAAERDGRLEKLRRCGEKPPAILGLGSWDPECPIKGQRYTICIEETEETDFSGVGNEFDLYSKDIGRTEWLCFEMHEEVFQQRFWRDNPYRMMGEIGFAFNTEEDGSGDTGLHFDVYPPDYDRERNPRMQFWITVVRKDAVHT